MIVFCIHILTECEVCISSRGKKKKQKKDICLLNDVFYELNCVLSKFIVEASNILTVFRNGAIEEVKWSEVAQSCPTLCDPMDCSPPGSLVHGIFRQEYCSGLPFPVPGDLPNPGTEPGSPALQADALPSETQGKPQRLNEVIRIGL